MTTDDLSTVSVLLDTLKNDSVQELIHSNDYGTEALEYLNFICNSDDFDLTKPDSITMELGELENKESLLRSQIQKKTVSSIDLILSVHENVNDELCNFNEKFNLEAVELYKKILEEDWRSSSDNITQRRQKNTPAHQALQLQQRIASDSSIILQNIDSIMDILELPLLTLACVKQGHYSESLEISSHAKRLSIRYSDIKIINKIESDIKLEINKMLVGLIRLLRTDLKQSSILKIMTYLKRINPFKNTNNDKELKLIYLQLRYYYVMSELDVLNPIKKSNVEKFLKRNIEVIREHCFSTIVVFENIFNTQDTSLLRELVLSIITTLIQVLRENLPLITDKSSKENLLLQLCYCSNSLNRIGFEFSTILLSELSKEQIITIEEWLTVSQRKKKLSF